MEKSILLEAQKISKEEIRIRNKTIYLDENKKWTSEHPLTAEEIKAVRKVL